MLKVKLLAHTPEPEKVIACAAKLCYSKSGIEELYDGLDDEKVQKFLEMLSDFGHESPIEHAVFTFAVEGVSRTLLAQLTRHRIASFSVQSQRYVGKSDFEYIMPPYIEEDDEAREIFEQAMEAQRDCYEKLTELLEKKHLERLLSEGLSPQKAASTAEKTAIEDARFVLPNACDTKLVMTMNARSLLNFLRLRCCNRAQWEIRELALEIAKLLKRTAPVLFKFAGPPCVRGNCPEGSMSCGEAKKMREFYLGLH